METEAERLVLVLPAGDGLGVVPRGVEDAVSVRFWSSASCMVTRTVAIMDAANDSSCFATEVLSSLTCDCVWMIARLVTNGQCGLVPGIETMEDLQRARTRSRTATSRATRCDPPCEDEAGR